ncbi:MAG: glycosyltransferase family 2 protein [Candidatus Omnitrophica bacterium]|nr:glycosyltransferase family 2 protein [Candidatus Omnitrophota bacterium]
MNIFFEKILYLMFLVFLLYFLLLTAFYLFLSLVGFIEGKRRSWESQEEDYPLTYLSSIAIPVSIIIPARNEEEWIRDSLLSVLNLNYPKLEVIIVDDDSMDRTFEIISEMLELKAVDLPYVKHHKDGLVRTVLKSEKYKNVIVIRKVAGTKKAGAVNSGLNFAKNEYVCVVDADTVLEQNALLKVMAHVEREPDKVIGMGSYFGLSNDLKIKDGIILGRDFSFNPIIAYQNLEYIRSFIGNRIGWSKYNAMPVVAGGFNVWRRDILYDLGGYSLDFTCEDIEFTFRAHDYLAKNKGKGYKIIMLPYSVGWTEGPSNVPSLILQRSRWQRVTDETVARYKYMILNPRYGWFAFLTLPYFLLYEVLGVFFEITSVIFMVCGLIFGVLDIKVFLAFMLFMILSQVIISLLSVFSFLRVQRLFPLRYIAYLIFLSFIEFFWYRWVLSTAKLVGTYTYFKGVKEHDQYKRAKRIPAS